MKEEQTVKKIGDGIHPDDFCLGITNRNGEVLPALRDEFRLPKSKAEPIAESKVDIQPSDHRFGRIDDDGQPMAEIVATHSGGEKDALPVIGDRFLKPIIIEDDLRDTFTSLLAKAGRIIPSTMPVYLCNKLVDPTVHPNDYIKLEGNEFQFTHLITTCQGVYPIAVLFGTQTLTNDVLEDVAEEFKEEHFDSVFSEEDEEPLIPKSLFDGIPSSELDTLDEEYPIPSVKIKELLHLFQQNCCEHRKGDTCKNRHFLVGEGNVWIEDEAYEGIFIYLYPDVHYEQSDNPNKEISDKHYRKFNENSVYPQNRVDYVVAYKEEFRKSLHAISK